MNAIDFIIKEHQKIRATFAKIAKGLTKDQIEEGMFNNLCHFLVMHETMEQKVWYPKLKKMGIKTPIPHLIKEEKTAAKTIKEFKKISTQVQWEKKFNQLKKAVSKHADEEEIRLFPKVEESVDEAELKRIGKQLATFKKNYKLKPAVKANPAKAKARKVSKKSSRKTKTKRA